MKNTRREQAFTQIVLEIFKVSGLFNAEGDRLTEEYGLSSARWKTLGAIETAKIPLTVPQIARLMGQSRQAVQRVVNVMRKDGLLSLLNNPDHKRAKLVTLTARGKEVYSKLEKKQIPWANHYSQHLNEKELDITLSVLKKITHRLEAL